MLIAHLQDLLQRQYDLKLPYEVSQFVSHDAELARELSNRVDNQLSKEPHDGGNGIKAEELFILQDEDSLAFTLYLDESILASFTQQRDAHQDAPPEASMDDLCSVVEGVSHAVCLLWHAHHERQIRPVDLELQAEIDKFMLMRGSLNMTENSEQLHQQLFSSIHYSSAPGSALRERYQRANDSAANYCRWLIDRFMDGTDSIGLHHELARFYRLSGAAKFDHINRLH